MKQLISELAGKMTKQQWKREQMEDAKIGSVLQLVQERKHLQYKIKKDDNAGMKIILRFRDDLKVVDGLLYWKWMHKNEMSYLQFVLPISNSNCLS